MKSQHRHTLRKECEIQLSHGYSSMSNLTNIRLIIKRSLVDKAMGIKPLAPRVQGCSVLRCGLTFRTCALFIATSV